MAKSVAAGAVRACVRYIRRKTVAHAVSDVKSSSSRIYHDRFQEFASFLVVRVFLHSFLSFFFIRGHPPVLNLPLRVSIAGKFP